MNRRIAWFGIACAWALACAAGKVPHHAGAPADEGPRLVSGLAPHHHPIATDSAEAQAFFDQGFAWVFAFNHDEATRSFERAAQLDPKSPMPQWGIAWSVGPNYNLDIDDPRAVQASQAIARAKELAADAPPHERAYVEAMAVRYSPDPKADRKRLARKYATAMRDLSRRYPDDLDAATLYAESLMNLSPWKLWTLDGKPGKDTAEIVRVLESVLRRDPSHVGANHYYIHAVEASTTPERALASAERLKTLAPAAGHLVHMPAHVYARTGDHAAAASANEAGVAADRAYIESQPSQKDSFYALAYASHNLLFLVEDQMMQGRFADAQRAAAEVADQLGPHTGMMPMMESMVIAPVSVLLRFDRRDDILALPEPGADQPVVAAWRLFARGVAQAKSGDADAAAATRAQLTAAIRAVPDTALFGGTGLIDAHTVLGVGATVLDARIAWARGQRAKSLGLWQRAVAAADRIPYDEPPIWFYPVRESYGAALLMADRAKDAERVFRDDLARHPRNPRSLFGLRESLLEQKRDADAASVDRQLDAVWRNADPDVVLAIDTL
jgi:tetratricopeptide (TPR) repeat protein